MQRGAGCIPQGKACGYLDVGDARNAGIGGECGFGYLDVEVGGRDDVEEWGWGNFQLGRRDSKVED